MPNTDECSECGAPVGDLREVVRQRSRNTSATNCELGIQLWVGLVLLALIGGFVMGWLSGR